MAYYSYHGGTGSSALNYAEVYSQLDLTSSLGQSELRLAYAWDYFGFDVEHIVATLAHTVEVTKGHNLRLAYTSSMSDDASKWAWDGGKSYNHYRLSYLTSWKGFDFDLSAEDTSMDLEESKARVMFSVARTFSF